MVLEPRTGASRELPRALPQEYGSDIQLTVYFMFGVTVGELLASVLTGRELVGDGCAKVPVCTKAAYYSRP